MNAVRLVRKWLTDCIVNIQSIQADMSKNILIVRSFVGNLMQYRRLIMNDDLFFAVVACAFVVILTIAMFYEYV